MKFVSFFYHADGVMREFYAAVENNHGEDSGPDGALFLAVCRGKERRRLNYTVINELLHTIKYRRIYFY